jgi:hypothetical protein
VILRSRMVSSGDATTMLLDGLSRLCCSAHGEHMSWSPFPEKPRRLRVPAGGDGKETAHPRAGQFGLSSTSLVSAIPGRVRVGGGSAPNRVDRARDHSAQTPSVGRSCAGYLCDSRLGVRSDRSWRARPDSGIVARRGGAAAGVDAAASARSRNSDAEDISSTENSAAARRENVLEPAQLLWAGYNPG